MLSQIAVAGVFFYIGRKTEQINNKKKSLSII